MSERDNPRRPWRTEEQWLELRERIAAAEDGAPARRANGARWLAAAALLLVAAGIVVVASPKRAVIPRVSSPFVVATGPGQRTTVTLSDSSLVTVGPSSHISFISSDSARDITLSGIAAFTVVHDRARPFVVHASNAVATDLGTAFVVRGYASDSVVEVAVTAGVVALSAISQAASALELRAGEVGRVGRGNTATRSGASSTTLAWMDGRLAFDNAQLGDVAADLGRWFDVDIVVPAPTLRHRRVSAIYNNPTLDGVLSALSATTGARIERKGRVITLSPSQR